MPRPPALAGDLPTVVREAVREVPEGPRPLRHWSQHRSLCRAVPPAGDAGASRPQLGITKCGDPMLRRLLITAAHYILGPFGPDTDLRRWGLCGAARGGTNAKQRAVVAVARKLAGLLYSLWVHGTVYQPLREGPVAQSA